jgi:Flp pilus assembly protein TadD
MGVPLSIAGAAARGGRAPGLPDLERIFAGQATDDPPAAVVAARAYNNLSVLAARAGDLPRAARLAERSAAVSPGGLALVNAGRYRLALGEDAVAARLLSEALRLEPGLASGWALLGVTRARAGRCADARRLLERARELDPSDEDTRVNLGLLGRCVETAPHGRE